MIRKLVLEFTKMNGAGNDFIVIDNRFFQFSDDELSDLARSLCPRRFRIGADGLLAFSDPVETGHHYRMRYFNADGSPGTMCGNGARCLARFARLAGIQDESMIFESDAGLYRAYVPRDPDSPIRLFVPPPRNYTPVVYLQTEVGKSQAPVSYIWTGTEHAICFVPDVAGTPVSIVGQAIRRDPALLPNGANVNFVQVLNGGGADQPGASIKVRTFEKGVEAETLACGTGALASAITARLLGHVHDEIVAVHMPGGVLAVGFTLNGKDVSDLYLEGPAEAVYRGTIEV